MSERAGGGGADSGGGGHGTRDDPWMSTVTSVSAFLAGFSLAAVVVIANTPDSFRWPGVAVLALTIASVVLVAAAQGSRNGAYYYEEFRWHWRNVIWVAYHGGIVALLAGLGAALVPVEGVAGKPGVGGQQGLRLAAACVAFAAAGGAGPLRGGIALLLLRETAIRPKHPGDARCIAEPEDGTAGVEIGAGRERSHRTEFRAGHEGADGLGIRLAVSFGSTVPAEFGGIDGLVTGVLDIHLHGRALDCEAR